LLTHSDGPARGGQRYLGALAVWNTSE
jgi:hypothetical protein